MGEGSQCPGFEDLGFFISCDCNIIRVQVIVKSIYYLMSKIDKTLKIIEGILIVALPVFVVFFLHRGTFAIAPYILLPISVFIRKKNPLSRKRYFVG